MAKKTPKTPPGGYKKPQSSRVTGWGESPRAPDGKAYGPSNSAFGPEGPGKPQPPIATSDTVADMLAPLPLVDKYPIIVGSGLSFAYLSAVQRTALTGYRQTYADLMREILERDPHLYAVIFKRIVAVASARFEVIPAILPEGHPDSERAIKIARDVERRVRRIAKLHRHIAFLGWAIYYAITGLEINWDWTAADGWNVDSLGFIHSRRLSFPDTGSWDLYIWDQGMVVSAMPYGDSPTNSNNFGLRVADYPNKFIIHAPQISGDYPTREGVGRLVSEWALSKRLGARTALAYLERFIKPWPMVSFNTKDPDAGNDKKGGPRVASTEDINGANAALAAVGVGALSSYTHADSIEVDLVTPDKQRPKITFREYNDICNAELSKGALGQTLTTEAGAHGGSGRGLGQVHQAEQKSWLEYDAMEMGETLSDQLFRPLTLLNHPDSKHLVPGCKIHIEESDPMAFLDLAVKASTSNIPVDADKVAVEIGMPVSNNPDPKKVRIMRPLDVTAPGDLDPSLLPAAEEGSAAHQQLQQRAAMAKNRAGAGGAGTDKWSAAREAKAAEAKPETGAPKHATPEQGKKPKQEA